MKTRVFTILGIIVLVVGVALGAIGMSKLNWNFMALDTEVFVDEVYTEADSSGLTEIKTDINTGDFKIVFAETTEITVDYKKSDRTEYTFTKENGVFTVAQKYKYFPLKMFNFGTWKIDITMTLPIDLYDINLLVKNGTVSLPSGNYGDVEISCRNSEINLSGINAKSLKLDSRNGKATVAESTSVGDITISTSNGKIELSDITAGGNMSLNSSNGAVICTKTTANDIKLYSSNQMVKADVLTAKKLDVASKNGKVMLNSIIADDIKIVASNGSASINIIGDTNDYKKTLSAKNGSISGDTQSHDGDKSLVIDNRNGSIMVSFS